MSLEGWRILTISMAAVGQTLFVLLYMTFPWYKTFLGRALFISNLFIYIINNIIHLILFIVYIHNIIL